MLYISNKPTTLISTTMAPPRLAPKSVDPTAAEAAHEELVKFIDSRNPGIVDKKLDTAVDFDAYLKTADLQKTNALIEDFLQVSGASRELLLACPSRFHLTDEVADQGQETRRRIPPSRRRQTCQIVRCALLRSTDPEKTNGLRESHNVRCAGPAVFWERAAKIRERYWHRPGEW